MTALYELYRICCRDEEVLVSVVGYVPDWVFIIVLDSVIDQRLIPIVVLDKVLHQSTNYVIENRFPLL